MRTTLRVVLLCLLCREGASLDPAPQRRPITSQRPARVPTHARMPKAVPRRAAGLGLAAASSLLLAQGASARELVWVRVADDVAAKPSSAFAMVERTYGLRFVEYLSRLLLEFDSGASNWWETRRRSAALQPTAARKESKRFEVRDPQVPPLK